MQTSDGQGGLPEQWPQGQSEMARRIRAHEWGATSLGPVESWPRNLCSAVDMLLVHGFPMVLLWGPDLIQIYNDGYRLIMAGKHPAGLGQPTSACWPEVWHINAPIYDRVRSGETVTFQDALYPIMRQGPLEDAWFTLTYSAMRGEGGAVAGVLVTVFETTERVLAEKRRDESQIVLSVALDGGGMGAWRWDVNTGLIRGDAKFLGLWGDPPSDEPHPLSDFTARMSPDGATEMEALVSKAVADGTEFDGQFEIVSGSTAGRWVRWRGRADASDPFVLHGVGFDVTEGEKAQEALRDSKDQFRALATASTVMLYRMSPDWRLMYQLSGRDFLVDTTEPAAEWVDIYLLPEDRPAIFAAINEAIRTQCFFEMEHRVRVADGGVGWVHSRAVPIFGPDGAIYQWFGSGTDITARRVAEERQAFLLRLSDRLRPLTDPVEVMNAASEALGRHLGAGRCGYGEVDASGEFFTVERDWTDGTMSSFKGRHRLVGFGPEFTAAYRAGRSVGVDDALADARSSAAEDAFEAVGGVRASLGVPLMKDGRFAAGLFVQQVAPRHWTAEDEAIAQEVVSRTWDAVERARSEKALALSEQKYRTLFETMDEGFYLAEAVFDDEKRCIDILYHDENPAAVQMTGRSFKGHRLSEMGAYEQHWLDIFGHTARTGESQRLERFAEPDGIFYDFSVFKPQGATRDVFAVMFRDVTVRRRAEDMLRESEERQAFLLKFSDALRAEEDESGIATLALRMLTDELRLDRCHAVVMFPAENRVDVTHEVRRPDLIPMPSPLRFTDFPEASRRTFDRTLVYDDTANDPDLTDLDKQSLAAMDFASFVSSPVRLGSGNPIWTLGAVSAKPRHWSPADVALIEVVAERTWAAMERARAETSLRDSEERFRSFAENSADVLWIVNAATRKLEYLSPSFAAMWGETRERVMADLGRWLEMIHPDDRMKASLAMPRTLAGETVTVSYRIVRPYDGEERWIQDTGFPIRDERGRITRVGGVSQDLTERTRTELEIRAKRRELRVLVESIPQLVWRAVDGGRWTWASPQWTAFTGQSESESHEWGWLEKVHPDDRHAAANAWQEAGRRGRYEADYRLCNRKGAYRWFQTRATPIHSDDGSLVEWIGTSTDIDDIRQLREHEKLLLAELQHRVRNTLGVIRSIVRRTAATSRTLEDYTMHLEGRIDAFARVQSSVTRDPGRGIDLEYLVAEELRAAGAKDGDTASIKGPQVFLSASAAETLGLAIHELATNAMKYGALSQPRAEIKVRWSIEKDEGEPAFDFRWTEQGVRIAEQPTRRGFGTTILTRTLGYELKAKSALAFTPTGLDFHLTVPLDRLQYAKHTAFP